ncbi:patatin-like phospholipase family protein [Paraburkholderia solitsugae]|nr:patatin-like phospholipase family protein [Paraburkholderia solitsugae]
MDRPIRRGLVIAGGGAKGAYSFGALKALHESDIKFEAVSATSAGALNAAIWATGQIEAGEILWRRVSPHNTYQFHGPLRLLPRTLAQLFLQAVILFNLGAHRILLGRFRTEYQQLAEYAAIFLAWAVATSVFVLNGGLIVWDDRLVRMPMSYGILALAAVFFLIGYVTKEYYFFAEKLAYGVVLSVLLLRLIVVSVSVFRAIDNGYVRGAAYVVFSVLVIALGVVLSAFLKLVLRILTRITTFSSAPLRSTIGEFLRDSTLTMPCFAAVAWNKLVYDPDRPVWRYHPKGNTIAGWWAPEAQPIWVPEYIRVDEVPPEARIDVLMASAAIPFGVVKAIVVNGKEYVDGGLADNEPITPLLQFGLDEIWLLSLDPNGKSDDERRDECLDLLRRPRLLGFDYSREDYALLRTGQTPYHLNIQSSPPRVIPYDEISAWPKITRLAPSTALGGVFASLHFSPKYAATLIEMGYRDTLIAVASRRAGPIDARSPLMP